MDLRQTSLVFKREYMSKIRSKGFLIATVLIPVGMIVFVGVAIGIAIWDSEADFTIGISDQTGQLYPRLAELNEERYVDVSDTSEDSLKAMITEEKISGYILLNDEIITGSTSPELVYGGSGGLTLLNSVENNLEDVMRAERLQQANVSDEIKEIYNSDVELTSMKLTETGEITEDNTGILSAIGLVMGFVIFGTLFGYGGLLTRSVIEEKTNRIVEVIASSVKPLELLVGKMAGIAALGLSQMVFWIATAFGISFLAAPVAGMLVDDSSAVAPQSVQAASGFDPSVLQLPSIEASLIIYFLIFFLLGYLLYSTFFAAIGAAVDSETDTQQYMLPVMAPIFIAYFVMFQTVSNPDGTLSVVSSLIPLFTPIIMITRIAITDVPFWQIGLSIVLMLLTFAGALWLCIKIYKTGILSYGQSANFKELVKWVKQG